MITRRRTAAALLVSLAVVSWSAAPRARATADTLPASLTDQQFWSMISDFSEDNGYFRSDNLLSNEIWYETVIPALVGQTKPGGVYLGVGPEQNFTYIAALKPKIAFITDIRRGNLHTQLMYKALFELSADRAEFMSRLFTKPRPTGLTAATSAQTLQGAYWEEPTSSDALYEKNLRDIDDLLTIRHHLPLPQSDLDGIAEVYHAFYWYGPSIDYNSTSGRGGWGNMADYASLMAATDADGVARSFLANEENFREVRSLEEKNLIVPVVGNFAGPKALRKEAAYLKAHGAVVTAFYLSNVEQYLRQDGIWNDFCRNVATLPLDTSSTFIRSDHGGGGGGFGGGLVTFLGSMQEETKGCGSGDSASR